MHRSKVGRTHEIADLEETCRIARVLDRLSLEATDHLAPPTAAGAKRSTGKVALRIFSIRLSVAGDCERRPENVPTTTYTS